MGTRIFASGVTVGGLDLSGIDDDGVQWTLSTFDGWSGSPASTLTLTQKSADHGAWRSKRPRLAARVLTATGSIQHEDPELVSLACDRLQDAVSLDAVRVTVDEGRRTRWLTAQREDDVIVDDSIETCYRYSLQLAAADPFKYADPVVVSTGLPSVSGGLDVPLAVPFALSSVVNSGVVSAFNPGNARGPVMLRIDGPVTGPVVTHVGTGLSLVFSASLALSAGEWLDVDMKNHRALANGTASRAGRIQQRGWSLFEPGLNTWAFSAQFPSADARLTATAWPAWK